MEHYFSEFWITGARVDYEIARGQEIRAFVHELSTEQGKVELMKLYNQVLPKDLLEKFIVNHPDSNADDILAANKVLK